MELVDLASANVVLNVFSDPGWFYPDPDTTLEKTGSCQCLPFNYRWILNPEFQIESDHISNTGSGSKPLS